MESLQPYRVKQGNIQVEVQADKEGLIIDTAVTALTDTLFTVLTLAGINTVWPTPEVEDRSKPFISIPAFTLTFTVAIEHYPPLKGVMPDASTNC